MYTSFYEGDSVSYVGDGADGIEPATGMLVHFASNTAAHVKWASGPRVGQIDLVDIYDLTPAASTAALQAPMITAVSVRMVMGAEGETGVVRYLAKAKQLESWTDIAYSTLAFVEARLKADASLDLAYEQLTPDEMDRVVVVAAKQLLKDAFGDEPEE